MLDSIYRLLQYFYCTYIYATTWITLSNSNCIAKLSSENWINNEIKLIWRFYTVKMSDKKNICVTLGSTLEKRDLENKHIEREREREWEWEWERYWGIIILIGDKIKHAEYK